MGNHFTKVKNGNLVFMNKQILFEILEKRIYETKVKIEDLFLLCTSPNGLEGADEVETPFGKLRVFFIKDQLKNSKLLHKSRFNYPSISQVRSPLSLREQSKLVMPFLDMPEPKVKDNFRLNTSSDVLEKEKCE